MYAWHQTIGDCPFCGDRVTEYVDFDDRSTFECGCCVGADYIRVDTRSVFVVPPDPARFDDTDPLWALRLADAEPKRKRPEAELNFDRRTKRQREAA